MTTHTAATPTAEMKNVLDKLAAFKAPPIPTLTPENARQVPSPTNAVMALIAEGPAPKTPPAPVVIEHRTIDGPGGQLLLRVYSPEGSGPFPVLVYFHGGGWVIANLDTYDSSCRALTAQAKCVVVSVAYRQAPEHKFPAAADDAFAAYQWVVANAAQINGDPAHIAVGGESAGGNLAAGVTLRAREEGTPMPVHQLLVYPVTKQDFTSESYMENAKSKPLDMEMMKWFWENYLGSTGDASNMYAAPGMAKDLAGLPSATVITAEIDPLRSEGEEYAQRLTKAGVSVKSMCYSGVTHEFFGMGAVVPEAKAAVAFAADGLKSSFMNGKSNTNGNGTR